MGPMGGMGSMNMALLPDWLRLVLALAMLAVLVLHVWHAAAMAGQARWWHVGHTTMATGMVLMFAVMRTRHAVLYGILLAVFVVALLVVAAVAIGARRREGRLNPLWASAVLDMAAMTYMLLPPQDRIGALTGVAVAYLAGQAIAWALGLWDRAPRLRPAAQTARGAEEPEALDHREAGAATVLARRQHSAERGQRFGLQAHCTPSIRISLAVMAASMGYMLLAM
ncbi:MAG: hypothetical protein ACRDRL_25795 [Sciscionella sp.]